MLLGAVSTPKERAARPPARDAPQAACPKRSEGTGRGCERQRALAGGRDGRWRRKETALRGVPPPTGERAHRVFRPTTHRRGEQPRTSTAALRPCWTEGQAKRAAPAPPARRRQPTNGRERWKPAGSRPRLVLGLDSRQRGPACRATPHMARRAASKSLTTRRLRPRQNGGAS